MPDPPSYSAARAMLAKLENKGYVRHRAEGMRYVFVPAISPAAARDSAVSRLARVFFGGSMARMVTGMVDLSAEDLSDDELEDLAKRVEQARARKTETEAGKSKRQKVRST